MSLTRETTDALWDERFAKGILQDSQSRDCVYQLRNLHHGPLHSPAKTIESHESVDESEKPELTLLQISDLHFGPPYREEAGEAVLRLANKSAIDAIIVSGDLTQRAKREQFEAARDFLSRLPSVPQLVIPGNHDVPLYRLFERMLAPHGLYQKIISSELNPVLKVGKAIIAGIDSTSPHTASPFTFMEIAGIWVLPIWTPAADGALNRTPPRTREFSDCRGAYSTANLEPSRVAETSRTRKKSYDSRMLHRTRQSAAATVA